MYKISFNLKSYDLDYLAKIENSLLSVFSFFHLYQVNHQVNPKRCKKITVLRSPHIDKKSREQFQLSSHKKTLVLTLGDLSVLLLLLEILKSLKFIGVELELLIEFSTFY